MLNRKKSLNFPPRRKRRKKKMKIREKLISLLDWLGQGHSRRRFKISKFFPLLANSLTLFQFYFPNFFADDKLEFRNVFESFSSKTADTSDFSYEQCQ